MSTLVSVKALFKIPNFQVENSEVSPPSTDAQVTGVEGNMEDGVIEHEESYPALSEFTSTVDDYPTLTWLGNPR